MAERIQGGKNLPLPVGVRDQLFKDRPDRAAVPVLRQRGHRADSAAGRPLAVQPGLKRVIQNPRHHFAVFVKRCPVVRCQLSAFFPGLFRILHAHVKCHIGNHIRFKMFVFRQFAYFHLSRPLLRRRASRTQRPRTTDGSGREMNCGSSLVRGGSCPAALYYSTMKQTG